MRPDFELPRSIQKEPSGFEMLINNSGFLTLKDTKNQSKWERWILIMCQVPVWCSLSDSQVVVRCEGWFCYRLREW